MFLNVFIKVVVMSLLIPTYRYPQGLFHFYWLFFLLTIGIIFSKVWLILEVVDAIGINWILFAFSKIYWFGGLYEVQFLNDFVEFVLNILTLCYIGSVESPRDLPSSSKWLISTLLTPLWILMYCGFRDYKDRHSGSLTLSYDPFS